MLTVSSRAHLEIARVDNHSPNQLFHLRTRRRREPSPARGRDHIVVHLDACSDLASRETLRGFGGRSEKNIGRRRERFAVGAFSFPDRRTDLQAS